MSQNNAPAPARNDAMTPEREAAQQAVRDLRARVTTLGDDGLDLLFRQARSHYGWTDRPVPLSLLERLYETVRFMPTAGNGNPARFVFVMSEDGKKRLVKCVNPGNVPKVMAAPVTAIVAYDEAFFEHLKFLHPHKDDAPRFRDNPEKARTDAFRNGSLQGAYLMLAARALGLDVGPMSGFSNQKADEEFFAGTTLKSNFLCNLGYADERGIFQRLPRLSFEQACQVLA